MKQLTAIALSFALALGLFETEDALPESTHAMAWLEGHWQGEGLGGTFEEVWLPGVNGSMLGTFRLIQNGSVEFYELVTIEDRADALSMSLKHFNPDLTGWEEQDAPLVWPGEVLGEGVVRFGPVEYERRGADGLRIRVELGSEGGTRVEELTCKRRK